MTCFVRLVVDSGTSSLDDWLPWSEASLAAVDNTSLLDACGFPPVRRPFPDFTAALWPRRLTTTPLVRPVDLEVPTVATLGVFLGVFNFTSDWLRGRLDFESVLDGIALEPVATRVGLVAITAITFNYASTVERYSSTTGTTAVSGPLSNTDTHKDNVWSSPTLRSWSHGLARTLSFKRDTCMSVVSMTRNKPRSWRRDFPTKDWLNHLRTKCTLEASSSGSKAPPTSSTKSACTN